ncbi:MAG: Rrf2 family transcriptional regulator [Pseudomonadota bacterium]
MQLSPRQITAIVCVIDIALHGQSRAQSSKLIASRAKINRRYLEQIMQPLVKAGIVQSIRGPQGGYQLARERRSISIAEIISCVNEPASYSMCGQNPACQITDRLIDDLRDQAHSWLRSVTVHDLCTDHTSKEDSQVPVHFSI